MKFQFLRSREVIKRKLDVSEPMNYFELNLKKIKNQRFQKSSTFGTLMFDSNFWAKTTVNRGAPDCGWI